VPRSQGLWYGFQGSVPRGLWGKAAGRSVSPGRTAPTMALVIVPSGPLQAGPALSRCVVVRGVCPRFRSTAWLVQPTVVAPTPAFFAGRLSLFEGLSDVLSPAGGCPTHRGRKEGLLAVRVGVPLSRML